MNGMRRTVVVGGGLAGLLAARRRMLAGDEVTLLEAEEQLGGAIGRITLAGVAISSGAEAYSIATGATDALVEELGLAEATAAPREGLGSRIVSAAGVHRSPGASLLGMPGHPLAADVRAVLGPLGALRAALERWLPARIGASDGASVQQVVAARYGRAVADRLVAPVVGGVHSADPRTLEMAAASPQLARGLREHGSLTAAVRAARGRSTASAGTRVRTLRPTMAALPEALAAQIRAGGGTLLTSAPVAAITADGEGWQVRAARRTVAADHLVLATGPDIAQELLTGAGERAAQLAGAIPEAPSAAVRLAALLVDAPALDEHPSGTGALVAPGTPGVRAKALTHVTAKWPHVQQAARRAHPAARSPHVLRLSYGRPGETLPDREQIPEIARGDASAVLGCELDADAVLASAVIDWSRAMRQQRPGHREALETLTRLLADVPQLELVGSWRAGTGIDALVRADRAAEGTARPTSNHPAPKEPA